MPAQLLAALLATSLAPDPTCACSIEFLSAREQRKRYDLIAAVTVEHAALPTVASRPGHPVWEQQDVRPRVHASWRGPKDAALTATRHSYMDRCGERPMTAGADYLVYATRRNRLWIIARCESVRFAEAEGALRELGRPRWSDAHYAALIRSPPKADGPCARGEGELRVLVVDPSGAVLPGAEIQVRHAGSTRKLMADDLGAARTCVPAGAVELVVDLLGFKTRRRELELSAGAVHREILMLELPATICGVELVAPSARCASGPLPHGGYRWCAPDIERLPLR